MWDIAFSLDGKTLFSCSDDKTVIIWKLGDDDKYHLATTLTGYHNRPIYSISVNHSNYIATGCGDNGIRVFVPEDDSYSLNTSNDTAHDSDINCVAWKPNTNVLASCGDDDVIKIWAFEV